MENTGSWRMEGMEVPLLSTDSIDWIQVSVPSSNYTPNTSHLHHSTVKDFASCCAVGNPPSYFIWKTCQKKSNMLEIIELNSHKETPKNGLQLIFPDVLFPFAFICKNECFASGNHFMLYALTISGVAYLIRLRNNFDYATSSRIPTDEILEYDTEIHQHSGAITAVSAIAGCLLIGKGDGSIGCFRLGILDPSVPGFMSELRDDAGFGRLWGILSRSPTLAAVQDLVISEVLQSRLLFVLHSDGCIRVWDLSSCGKIFSHTMTVPKLTGAFLKLWVGEANNDTGTIPLAILHKQNLDVSVEYIILYGLRCMAGDRILLSLEPSYKKIFLGEDGPIDVKLSSNRVWILKEEGLMMHELFYNDIKERSAHYYASQERLIADLLYQSPEHSSDDLLWLAYTAFSSSKEEISPFISSVFLHGLLFPGVHCNAVLRQTLGDYNKHFTDSEFGSLTVDGLKDEILSLIQHQAGYESPVSILRWWKTFCAHYMNNWSKINAVCGLLIDPATGAIGLVRKSTISICRGLEDVEHIAYGFLEEHNENTSPGLDYFGDELDQKILFELLECVRKVRQQLGKASSAIFYESLLSTRNNMSSEEVIHRFIKILETGYSSSIASMQILELGADTVRDKELANHRNLRKFSADILLALHAMCNKATSWKKVLGVVESYIKFLVPRKTALSFDSETVFLSGAVVVNTTTQIAKVMFEFAFDVLILLSYITSISGQIYMSYDDVLKVKLELIPMIQEIITEWHIIHFLGTTPSEFPATEDFSSRLSSLQIDSHVDRRLWNSRLGKCEFSCAFILLMVMQNPSAALGNFSFKRLPCPTSLVSLSRELTSWIIWGTSGEESSFFFSHSIDIATILIRHCQYNAAEYLLNLVDAYTCKERIFESLQAVDGKLATLFHFLGGCLVAQTKYGLHRPLKDRKVGEAVRCFFRAASVEGSSEALQSLPHEAGWLQINSSGFPPNTTWKLQYYQWVMQLFEQYNMSEAACQFALAALEQVDESYGIIDSSHGKNYMESVTSIKGRLWANVFKFTLDLKNYHDAYCAIISNPDEDSKDICLRRFIIVLHERGAIKMLCDGQLPLIGLADKVERELASKAERSDLSTKPNPFKLLYAFEMHRHNWRRAASYIYLYSVRFRAEAAVKDHQTRSLTLQERLNGLSTAINALQLVHPAHAWIEAPVEEISRDQENYPHKKPRIFMQEQSPSNDVPPQKQQSYLDLEKLENEFVLASAEYKLSLANVKWTVAGYGKPSSDLIDLLVESSSYDMAFTVILKFWKGSGLKRELERVFITMALKCCSSRPVLSLHGKNHSRTHGLLLTSSQEEIDHDLLDAATKVQQYTGNGHWGTLESYLDKYRALHPRLPLTIAGTLLSADPRVELPLWLVRNFKDAQSGSSFGMTGNESSPASLFGLYVDYGRYAEAVNLLIEYVETLASVQPVDVIHRKKPCAVWFPYTLVERLWYLLDESIRSGHRIDHCEKLNKLLHGVLLKHLNLLKVDSDDIKSSAL